MKVLKIYREVVLEKDSLTAKGSLCEFYENSLSEFDQNYNNIFSSRAFFIHKVNQIYFNGVSINFYTKTETNLHQA